MRIEEWKALGYAVYDIDDFTQCPDCEEDFCDRCNTHAADCPCQTTDSIDLLEPEDMEWIEELLARQREAGSH